MVKIAYDMAFKKKVGDVRSDDEDTDAEVEEKEGEGYVVGVSGGEATEKKRLENGGVHGVNGVNGGIVQSRGVPQETVMEGKKQR